MEHGSSSPSISAISSSRSSSNSSFPISTLSASAWSLRSLAACSRRALSLRVLQGSSSTERSMSSSISATSPWSFFASLISSLVDIFSSRSAVTISSGSRSSTRPVAPAAAGATSAPRVLCACAEWYAARAAATSSRAARGAEPRRLQCHASRARWAPGVSSWSPSWSGSAPQRAAPSPGMPLLVQQGCALALAGAAGGPSASPRGRA
mmetsp:Transcript_85353/g.241639  ORF Transcript_85353/g.241639 Transcript_85353/m.241639 type:complete len:208 (+) Transcript_85353:250-873(+)